MIKVFSPTDKVFYSNGDVVIKATSAKVHCEDNGDYYIEIIAGIEYSEWLVARNIVVAPTPDGDQPFRLEKKKKNGTKITRTDQMKAKCSILLKSYAQEIMILRIILSLILMWWIKIVIMH